jgi:hypothetical protein
MRLRSFNSVGNPNMQIGQADVGAAGTVTAGSSLRAADRWFLTKTSGTTLGATSQRQGGGAMGSPWQVAVPGTNFFITDTILRITLTTAQASLAAGDLFWLNQQVEGTYFRELQGDVHSCALLVRSSAAGLKFGVAFRDPASTSQSLVKLATIPSANTWTLIPFPNLPLWASSGTFTSNPGSPGYQFSIALAAGSNWIAPANDIWQSGNFVGAVGQSNFAASPVNSTFDVAFIQHEPGPQCTTLIDKPFTQNLDECLRYYCKGYAYNGVPGTAGPRCGFLTTANLLQTPAGYVSFHRPMAKNPAMVIYSDSSGVANAARDQVSGNDRGVSTVVSSEHGFAQFTMASAMTQAGLVTFCYTADTGW